MKAASERRAPQVMGILNVTPDSFYDGARHDGVEAAIGHGLAMAAAGAAIIDVGGESTRPGAEPVPAAEQIRRVEAVVTGLRAALPPAVLISIDTTSAEVAAAALAAGAGMINDVSAGLDDAAMLPLAARSGANLVLMHRPAPSTAPHQEPHYRDVVREVADFLLDRAGCAREAGVAREALLLDPGIGFGKGRGHNLSLLRHLAELVDLGYPLVLGVSRKRFMGSVCADARPEDLLPATCACTALGLLAGVQVFRVHDVAENLQVLRSVGAILQAD